MDDASKRFRKWRRTNGLTLDEVTEAVNRHLPGKGVGRSTVNNYEARTEPSLAFLRALKKAYPTEVHVEWFMFGRVIHFSGSSLSRFRILDMASSILDDHMITGWRMWRNPQPQSWKRLREDPEKWMTRPNGFGSGAGRTA